MREIKFRAFIEGELIYWSLVDMCGPHVFSMRSIICPWLLAGGIPDHYTNLIDKNGAEIYEGDIVVHSVLFGDNQVRDKIKGAVYYRNGCYYVDSFVDSRDGPFHKTLFSVADLQNFAGSHKYACQVIGNIHQNPELLK